MAGLLKFWEACLRCAWLEVSVWRQNNADRIARADELPPGERAAAYVELLREAMAPVVGALDDIERKFRRLH